MNEPYEYRLAGRRRNVWLAAAMIVFLIGITSRYQSPQILGVIWCLAAVMLGWMMMGNPIAGMRVDDHTLTLSAWRKPREIPLSDIDHIRVKHWTEESDVFIVYRDGTEEEISCGDLPRIPILEEVMAERGIIVRDPRD
jgi:hypothetical protein